MANTIEKWTLRLFTIVVMAIGLITSIKLLGGRDLTQYISGIVTIVLGFSIAIELGWKHIRALFDTKFQSSDVLDGILLISAILCIASGMGLLLNIAIPAISSFSGIIVLVATILLIPQLFLGKGK